jgi:crotonobetainyl-CoA:carnitine CoA-transferase CaiB-like acyl-CoA transferase
VFSGGKHVPKVTRDALCDGLKVVDFGAGLAGGLVAKMFLDAGAQVTRVISGRDPFADLYPAYALWQRGKTVLHGAAGDAVVVACLEAADLCIVGGEDHPDAPARPAATDLTARFPNLVVLDIGGDPAEPARPAVDLLAQVQSGYCNEQYSARPIAFAFPLAAYAAALHGTIAALAALCDRELSHRGQLVSTTLREAATMWCAPHWFEAERPTPALLAEIPRDIEPLIFRCADGRYIHFMMGTPGAVMRLHRILGIDDPTVDPNDRGMPTGRGEKKNFWGNIELIQRHIARFTSDEALQALWDEGIGAERVEPPGACWSDPQVVHNAILTRTEIGERLVGMPIQHSLPPADPVPPPDPLPEHGRGPLAGLKICDFGSFVAGPYLSVLLGDLGAEVIKVEGLAGEVGRALFRAFACTNRGKRSICVDVKSPGGAEVVRRLVAWADIVHHNFRPGVSARLGIDAATLQRTRPEIIVGETSGYGPDGPKAQRSGFDMLFQAFCGHEFRGSGEGDLPLWNRSAIVDFGGGLLTAIGVLFALLNRRRGKAPPGIHVNLLDTGLYLMSELIQRADGSFAGAPRMNRALTGAHPAERLYQVADGWVAIVVRGEAMARRLGNALGIESELGADPAAWNEAGGEALAAALAPRTLAETVSLLDGAGIWHEIAYADQRDRALADQVLQKCGVVLRTEDPEFGDYRQIGPAFRFSRTPLALDRVGQAPGRGQHTGEILAALGYTESEVAMLVAEKAVA